MAKNILITGTSSGFGNSAAKALAAKGHHVFATMRGTSGKNEDAATALRKWGTDNGHKLSVLELDVTSDDAVKQAVDKMVADAGSVDVLVNNAGVGTFGVQEAFGVDQVQKMFDVNVFGVLRANQAVIPHMRKNKSGHIIYVSSGLGRIIFPFLGPYTASKHAIEAIAEAGSYELTPQGIHTSILQPGAYGTNFLGNSIQAANAAVVEEQPQVKAMFEGFAGGFEERVKAGELGDPQEVVDALVGLVEKPDGPLRTCVGADVKDAVTPINETCAKVQGQLLAAFGIK